MTRFARGGPANQKKPHEASSWASLSDQVQTNKCKKNLKRTHQNSKSTSEERQKLEKLKYEYKDNTEASQAIDKAIHNDYRRENRRVKRIEKKELGKACFNCRKPGHSAEHCPEAKDKIGYGICFKCGSTEHSMHGCRVKVPDGQLPYATCFICKETGHLSNQCPDNPRGLYPNGGCCRSCGSVEHFKKDCPEFMKKSGIANRTLETLAESNVDDEVEDSLKEPIRTKKIKVVKF